MSERLNDLQDTIGWANKDDWREHTSTIFDWIKQATREIDGLQKSVNHLSAELAKERRGKD